MATVTRRRHHDRAGWFATDTMIGLAIVAALLAILSTAMLRQTGASQRLAETRESMRLAEQTLIALQTSVAPPATLEGANIVITPLRSPAAVDGQQWVRVDVTRGGRTSTLLGVAPIKNLSKR